MRKRNENSRREGLPVKRAKLCVSTLLVVILSGPLGLPSTPAQHKALNTTRSLSEKASVYLESGPFSRAKAELNKRRSERNQPLDKPLADTALRNDREKVEVLARNVTFPEVLNLGELLLSLEYPNSTLFCLDAALYAGQVEGLILAMDRDTVLEHELYWTIDNAKELFDACAIMFLTEAVADQNVNDKSQLENVKEALFGQIWLIQQKLSFAREVKVRAQEGPVCVKSTRVMNNHVPPEVIGAGQSQRVDF